MSRILDSKTGLQILRKKAGETRNFYMDLAVKLPSGTTISGTPTAVSTNQANISGSSNVTVGTVTVSGTLVKFSIAGGTALEDYLITVTATLNTSEIIIGKGILQVRDL